MNSDLAYLALTAAFFVLCVLYARACERIR